MLPATFCLWSFGIGMIIHLFIFVGNLWVVKISFKSCFSFGEIGFAQPFDISAVISSCAGAFRLLSFFYCSKNFKSIYWIFKGFRIFLK